MVAEFSKAYKALGGTIVSDTPYNEKQSSYQAEVTAAMAGEPDGLYLVSYPVDGATIARAWISQGGPGKVPAERRHERPGLHRRRRRAISERRLRHVVRHRRDALDANTSTTTTRRSPASIPAARRRFRPTTPARSLGLAVVIAGKGDAAAIKDAVRKVVDPNGTVIHAGKDEFAKAIQLIKDGKPIKYEGVIGPITFDQYGDITGPFRLWRIKDGEDRRRSGRCRRPT